MDASVTPSTVGACWAAARSSSSATRSRRVAARVLGGEVVGQADERGQGLPAVAGGAPGGRRLLVAQPVDGQHARTAGTERAGLARRPRRRRGAAMTASRTSRPLEEPLAAART